MNAKLNSASVKYQRAKDSRSRSILERILSIALMGIPSAVALCLPLIAAPAAQAVPLPKDWCGRIWGIQTATGNNAVIGWDNPITGVSNSSPPTNVATIPALPTNGSFAALGLHARSGTFYTLDRSTHTLYQYSMSTGGSWTSTVLPQIPNIGAATNTNFNKMTVVGDTLIIASSDSLQTFTYNITPATGALTSNTGTAATFTWASGAFGTTPGGNPPGPNSIFGGDIAQDEYGDTYNLTYDNAGNATPQYAYVYKKVGNTWEYRGRAQKVTNTDQFAGFAIYNDTLYAKGTAGQLFSIPLTRAGSGAGSEYNWSNNLALTSVGGIGAFVTDLATCGLPAMSVTKTQSVYTDPTATTLTTDQTRTGTGQYIKYTIVVKNQGDAWARGTLINDPLPTGVTYIANSATVNSTNINAATYPFVSAAANSCGISFRRNSIAF